MSRDGDCKTSRDVTVCHWVYDDIDNTYTGDCGICWSFPDGDRPENDCNFCPKCARKIKEVKT